MAQKKSATKKPDLEGFGVSLSRALKRHGVEAGEIAIHPVEAAAATGTCLKPFVENGRIVFRRVPC